MPTQISSGMPVITIDINEMGQMKQTIAEIDPTGAAREHAPRRVSIPAFAWHVSMSHRESSKITRRTKSKSR